MDTLTVAMPPSFDMAAPKAAPDPQAAAWHAVLARDAAADGRVFYGVRSTGIYCKPSCPSRRPRREQVEFFSAAEAAEGAGFRACRRCHPNQPQRQNAQVAAVARVCEYIRENLDASLTLDELARPVGLSPFHLQRLFKRATGVTPKQYIAAARLGAFKQELRLNRRNVTDATYHAGYSSGSRVYEMAAAELGMTPAAYRKGAPGEQIEYGIVRTSLGELLVARTSRGICAARLGDNAAALERELRAEFPGATLRREDSAAWLPTVLADVEGDGPDADERLPLDVRVTAFQRRVYQALLRIPRGETRSYQQVAQSLGMPTASRAVARACATNPIAVLVPCHRVVRGDGALAGYRWGVERKRKLLARERSAQQS
jgi:AraC family transcriptional regulator of adaptative response/methylated-DNA-[protein]-cysteine methyltransferase